jgi:phosphate transport system substrate-binding protein
MACVHCTHAAEQSNGTSAPIATIEWALPSEPTHRPQTEEEATLGKEHGRALPEPELLQPRLDAALPEYRPLPGRKLAGNFKAASSDVLPGLVKLWIDRFTKYYPNVHIALSPPYAGSLGAKELVKESLDFVFVSRELKPDDISDFRARFGYDPLSVPICGGSYRDFGFLDAIAFFVHPDNPLARLSFDQLDAIYSSTRHRGGMPMTTWGQLGLRGEWADKPVHAYGIKPWNGFEEFVRQRVLSWAGKRGEWRTDIGFDPVVFPVASRVSKDPYGIGFAGIAYLDASVKVLSLAAESQGPFVAPTYESVAAAQYPLSRLVFFNVNRQPGKPLPAAVEEFLKFVLSREGQQLVLDQAIFLPLRAAQARDSRALLQ